MVATNEVYKPYWRLRGESFKGSALKLSQTTCLFSNLLFMPFKRSFSETYRKKGRSRDVAEVNARGDREAGQNGRKGMIGERTRGEI